MTHPTPPKRYKLTLSGDMVGNTNGRWMPADEALAYAEAVKKQAFEDGKDWAARYLMCESWQQLQGYIRKDGGEGLRKLVKSKVINVKEKGRVMYKGKIKCDGLAVVHVSSPTVGGILAEMSRYIAQYMSDFSDKFEVTIVKKDTTND